MVVFRCSDAVAADDERIDSNMMEILKYLDGHRTLASIAFITGMNMSDFQKSVKALIALSLIEPVAPRKVLMD
jgi:Ni,Fe-hydrogenase III large subunit